MDALAKLGAMLTSSSIGTASDRPSTAPKSKNPVWHYTVAERREDVWHRVEDQSFTSVKAAQAWINQQPKTHEFSIRYLADGTEVPA